ncbi:MAG: hypothetical protein CL927_20765 [Deltaproteobacteria bacterium]|nr:hypothetical protein [Deltaproteobacteria bacterium]HCH65239.1 hypothetical protein [Deltaproteobacteria bacterium]
MLTTIAPGLWGFENDLFMPGGIHFRGRTTVVRLASGGLLLHSPNPITDTLAAEIESLGPVEVLVAPNNLHHTHFAAAATRWPTAQRWGAPGLPKKRPDLDFHHILQHDSPPWASTFAPIPIDGIPWLDETVFFHRETGTLVFTDLFFNIHNPANWQTRLLFWMYGILGRPAQSPLVRLAAKDRPRAGQSAQSLLNLQVERLVPAHGPVVEDHSAATLEQVLARQVAWAPTTLTHTH